MDPDDITLRDIAVVGEALGIRFNLDLVEKEDPIRDDEEYGALLQVAGAARTWRAGSEHGEEVLRTALVQLDQIQQSNILRPPTQWVGAEKPFHGKDGDTWDDTMGNSWVHQDGKWMMISPFDPERTYEPREGDLFASPGGPLIFRDGQWRRLPRG